MHIILLIGTTSSIVSGAIDAVLLAPAFSAYYHFDLVLAAALIDLSFNLILVAAFIASAFLA